MAAEDRGYEAVIGLEVHCQALTNSKMFCGCPNAFGGEPNTRICPVCTGYPGVLPVINREAVRKTIIAGLMCHCKISTYSKFDRKNYFYPDMPKNYQISQYDIPFCEGGYIPISGKGFSGEPLPDKKYGLTRIHLEEDVAKSTHLGRHSVIDYNRAGVPLLEIVSEPDGRSPDEAYAYLIALKQALEFAGVGDCNMEKGQMRCDVNVSVRPLEETEMGTKIELKNLNSFRAVHRGLEFEIERQIDVLEEGGTLRQETRRWDDTAGETFLMRVKEEAHDYRYFPEPDLPPVTIDQTWLEEIQADLPETPWLRRERLINDYQIKPYDANVITQNRALADFYEEALGTAKVDAKKLANWVINDLLGSLNEAGLHISKTPITSQNLAELVNLIEGGTINNKAGKEVFAEMFQTGKTATIIVEEKDLKQVSDSSELETIVQKIIDANPKAVGEYQDGNKKSLQFLIGMVMKETRGKANPKLVNELFHNKLNS